MKKLLALVLALVMTLGLATVAANATYPDEADVSLNEAVDVMTAVGVFKGDETGNFKPKANLDRAAAAKLIAYLDLGEKAAEALPAVKAFNDVPASHWAAKYIAYCADAGYITGAGDGNFYPSNALTGYAFGKMILCVLGYDASIEGFTGSSWTISVARLMQSNDIADGIDSAASANLTREQAAQYCLNALQADMVEYDNKGTSIEINGAKIATGASKSEKVEEKKKMYDGKDDGVQQLCEKLYDTDLKLLGSTSSDDFGAPAVAWKYKTTEVGTYADTPDATYTGKVTKGTIYTLLGKDVSDDLADKNAKMVVYIDGSVDSSYTNEAVKGSSAKAFGTGKGNITEVYINDDGNGGYALVTVVVKNVYLLQATSDYNSKTEKLAYTVLSGKAKSGSLSADDFALEQYKEDDYICYTYANGKVQEIAKAEIISGKVESYKSGDNVTISGKKYDYSKNFAEIDGNKIDASYSINESTKVVLDTQGNIIGIDSVKESNDDVVFVKQTAKNGFDFQAKIVTVDGKKLTVTLDEDSTDANDKKISDSNVDNFFGFMSYDIQKDGTYELSAYDKTSKTTAASSIKLNKNNSVVSGLTANASTVYIVEDEDGDITLYTGTRNAPDTVFFSSADSAYVVYNNDKKITYLYANATSGIEEASNTNDQQIYVLKIKSGVTTDSNDKKYYEVEALVDGSVQLLKVADGKSPFTVGKLYKSVKTDSNGYINGATEVNSDYMTFTYTGKGDDAFDFDDGTFTVTGVVSRDVKTEKAYVILTAANEGDNDLMDDPAADYELGNVNGFKALDKFANGYEGVEMKGYILFNDDANDVDSEITAIYVSITKAAE